MDPTGRLNLVSKDDKLSVAKQAELLGVNRTSFYYTPVKPDGERETVIKNRIDFWHIKMPYLRVRKIWIQLQERDGLRVGHKLIKRYMDEMGICAVYPKPNLSKPNKQHRIYPYLFRNLDINHANQVWQSTSPTSGWAEAICILQLSLTGIAGTTLKPI